MIYTSSQFSGNIISVHLRTIVYNNKLINGEYNLTIDPQKCIDCYH
jgi:hypothetical protein